jgi:hypothetical protein
MFVENTVVFSIGIVDRLGKNPDGQAMVRWICIGGETYRRRDLKTKQINLALRNIATVD